MDDSLKRASWLELFYDVAYVALIAQLTYLAAEYHSSLFDVSMILVVGYAIFIAWWGTTANRNLLPVETKSDKIITQLQMVGAFVMSLSMPYLFEGKPMAFFFSLGIVRILQTLVLVKMYYYFPKTRPATYNISQGFTFAASLWILSAFIPNPFFIVTAFCALLIDVLTPLTVGKGNTIRYLNVHHLQERLGLFLMLVIGESMIVVALSSNVSIFSMAHPVVVFSGLGLMISLWWLYFEHSDQHLGVRPKNLFLFLHAHGFLFGSIILVSIAYKLIIEGNVGTEAMTFLLLGAFGICITILLIRSTIHEICHRSFITVGLFVLLAAVLAVAGTLTGQIHATAIGITILYAIGAKLDYSSFFGELKK